MVRLSFLSANRIDKQGRYLIWLELFLNMNRISFLILSAKSKYPREGHVILSIFDSLGGPIECNLPFIIVQGRVKLR